MSTINVYLSQSLRALVVNKLTLGISIALDLDECVPVYFARDLVKVKILIDGCFKEVIAFDRNPISTLLEITTVLNGTKANISAISKVKILLANYGGKFADCLNSPFESRLY